MVRENMGVLILWARRQMQRFYVIWKDVDHKGCEVHTYSWTKMGLSSVLLFPDYK